MSLGRNLEIIIKREKCKVRWLAEKAGVSQPTINNIISGRKAPLFDNLYYIYDAMGYILYLVAPDGRKQHYESISDWLDLIIVVEDVDVKGLAEMFQCSDRTIYAYLSDERSPSIHYIQSFVERFGYSVKVTKGNIEYDLFEPIDIWEGKFEWM